MSSPSVITCHHCGVSFRWPPREYPAAEGTLYFCCHGCLGAYRLICGAGLDAYYSRSDRLAPTVADLPRPSPEALAATVRSDGPWSRIDLYISGISCPSCIWLLERVIARIDGVAAVSLTHSAGTAAVHFDPSRVSPGEIYDVVARLGYEPRPYSPDAASRALRREYRQLLVRLGTAFFLTMQLMAFSFALYAGYFQGISPLMKDILQLFSLAVATPVVFYCGWPFFRGAWNGLRSGTAGMDLLIALGAGSAWLVSVAALLQGQETYFESAAMIVTFVLVGRLLEANVHRAALSGVEALYAAIPQQAHRCAGTIVEEVAAVDIRTGDRLLVRAGERFPVDVRVEEGTTEIDQSLVSGESIPLVAAPGAEVKAGCINVSLPVTVSALRPLGQSFVMRVADMVTMAQAQKPDIQLLADRVARWFVPAVVLAACLLCAANLLRGVPPYQALITALTVVLIACPCAFGLAVPTAVLAACSRAAALGILFRGGNVIERLARITSVIFDKTGTLSEGRPQVVRWGVLGSFEAESLLQIAATVERPSAHPLARAIERCAAEHGILPAECRHYTTTPGKGITAVLTDGRQVLCGSRRFLGEQGVDLSPAPAEGTCHGTEVLLAVSGSPAGFFVAVDRLRAGVESLAPHFSAHGIQCWLASGDGQPAVAGAAERASISRFRAELTPVRKLDLVRDLQAQRGPVLMVGDGINDAPALAAADVSCSMAGSSDIAVENADLVITGTQLMPIVTAHRIAASTMSVIRQNMLWAFLYNGIGIPLAVTGHLTPVYAAVAMTASSIMVSLNSLRLMRIRPHG